MTTSSAVFALHLHRRHMLATIAGSGLSLAVAGRLAFAQDTTPVESGATPKLDKVSEALWTKINLNTITSDAILTIPGAGDRMVREFAEYRPWVSLSQFRAEIGKYVDEDVIAGYLRYMFVPVNPNDADSETLQQLPGVSEEIATSIVDARPFTDTNAFLDLLGTLVSPEQAAQAPAYLAAS